MLVIAAASAWHVRRALEDLRRALPEAKATLVASSRSLARISPQFPEVTCVEERAAPREAGLAAQRFDLVVVVGEVESGAAMLAQRAGARLLVQYNARGYFAGGAAFASPSTWRGMLLASALRRAVALPAISLLSRAYRIHFGLCRAIPSRHCAEITCPLCGRTGRAPVHWGVAGQPPYVRCPGCGLVQLSRPPSEAALIQVYDDIEQHRAYLETRTDPVTRFRHERVLSRIERWTHRGRVLDVGCADGRFLEVAADAGWTVEGVETSSMFARHAEALLGPVVHVGTLESAAFPDGRFDAVNISHVIEHLLDPRGHLAEVRRVLKDHRVVAISTPNPDSLSALVQRGRWPGSEYKQHVTLFGIRQLSRLLDEAGFRLLEVQTQALGRILGPLWASTLFGAVPTLARRRIEAREPQLNEYLGIVGMGEELFVLARKR